MQSVCRSAAVRNLRGNRGRDDVFAMGSGTRRHPMCEASCRIVPGPWRIEMRKLILLMAFVSLTFTGCRACCNDCHRSFTIQPPIVVEAGR
jgi:hypothetical protein